MTTVTPKHETRSPKQSSEANRDNVNSNTNTSTVDSLAIESSNVKSTSPSSSYVPNVSNESKEECERSHKAITISLFMFLFYLLTMLCFWIGIVDSLGESYERYKLDYFDSADDDWIKERQQFSYPFLLSNVLFTVALLTEIWVWHHKR